MEALDEVSFMGSDGRLLPWGLGVACVVAVMKAVAYRLEDYLEWLKDQEEYALYCLEMSPATGTFSKKEAEEELRIIRELKDLVSKYEERDD